MIKVGVLGAGGRMGTEACRAVQASEDLLLVGAVDPGAAGVPLASLTGTGSRPDECGVISGDLDTLVSTGAEVAVDFTLPGVVMDNLRYLSETDIHAVVGTSGFSRGDLEELGELFGSGRANCVVAPNFAIGAVLMMKMAEIAAPFMDSVEIIEFHHDGKADAPSGTAVATASALNESRDHSLSGGFPPDRTTRTILEGARGASGPGGVRIHSVRLPGLTAHQEVIFGSAGQTLTIRHDSFDRASFMPGVVAAIRAVVKMPGLTVGLEKVLGI